MTHDSHSTPVKITPAVSTTKRGFATASFSLGLWGLIVFWWYPFGMSIATVGVLCGIVTLAMGIRAGKDGENLAALGIFFGSCSIGFAIASYRFMQMAFEEAVPRWGWSSEYETALSSMAVVLAVVGVTAATYAYLTRPTGVPPQSRHHDV